MAASDRATQHIVVNLASVYTVVCVQNKNESPRVSCVCVQRSELGEEGMSVVGGLVARALEQDFATGFRPEDTLSPRSAPLISPVSHSMHFFFFFFSFSRESERPSMALCKYVFSDIL